LWRQVFAIHFVGQQHIAARFLQRNTARELQFARRTFRVLKHAAVGSFENYFPRVWLESRSIEQDREWHSGPLRSTDCAESPLHAFYFRFQKIPVVPGAFQSRRGRDRREGHELLVINCERFFYFAVYMQPPRIAIDRRDWKMRSNIEGFRWRNTAVQT